MKMIVKVGHPGAFAADIFFSRQPLSKPLPVEGIIELLAIEL